MILMNNHERLFSLPIACLAYYWDEHVLCCEWESACVAQKNCAYHKVEFEKSEMVDL